MLRVRTVSTSPSCLIALSIILLALTVFAGCGGDSENQSNQALNREPQIQRPKDSHSEAKKRTQRAIRSTKVRSLAASKKAGSRQSEKHPSGSSKQAESKGARRQEPERRSTGASGPRNPSSDAAQNESGVAGQPAAEQALP